MALIGAILTGVILLPIWGQINQRINDQYRISQRIEVTTAATSQGVALSNALHQRLALLIGLRAYIISELNLTADLDARQIEDFSAKLYSEQSGIRRFWVISQDQTLQVAYPPLSDPAGAPAFELLNRIDLERALQSRAITVSHPPPQSNLDSIQYVGWAVFVQEQYWGLVGIELDLQAILSEVGLLPQPANYQVALVDLPGNAFYGNLEILAEQPVIYQIQIPNSGWVLAAIPAAGWSETHNNHGLFVAAEAVISVLLAALVYITINRQIRLETAIRQRTRLIEAELVLRAQNEALIRQYAERLKTQHEIDQAILAAISPQAIAEAVLHHIQHLVDCEWVGLVLLNPDQRRHPLLAQYQSPGAPVGSLSPAMLEILPEQLARLQAGQSFGRQALADLAERSALEDDLYARAIQAYTALPLLSQERLIGCLVMGRIQATPLQPEQLSIAREIADSLAVAIQQAQLNALEQQQRQELTRTNSLVLALSQVTASVESLANPDQVVATLGRELKKNQISCYIALYEPQERSLRIRYISTLDSVNRHLRRFLHEHLIGWQFPQNFLETFAAALEEQRGEFIPDADLLAQQVLVGTNPKLSRRIIDNLHPQPQTPAIVLPLVVDHQAQGILVLWGPELRADDLTPLSLFANQIAIVLKGSILFEAEARRRQESDLLRRALEDLTANLEQDQILHRILHHLNQVVAYDHACLFLLHGTYLKAVAAHGHPQMEAVIGQLYPAAHDLTFQEVRRNRVPTIIADASRHPAFQGWSNTQHVRGWMCVPLIARDTVIGCLTLDSYEPAAYDQRQAELAQAFANYAAVALDNAGLYASTRRRADQLNALHTTLTEILSELELSKLLRAILARAVELLDASGGDLGLYLPELELIEIVASNNMDKDYTGTHMALGEGAMGQVARTLKPLIVENYTDWAGKSPQYANGLWLGVMAAPLIAGKSLIGTIGIVDSNPSRVFGAADLGLLELFAQQAAIAVQNARIYGEVKRLSTTDAICGIANRRHLFEIGQREVRRAQRFGRPLAAIMFDIDAFKQINDVHGHSTGDEILYGIAQRIKHELRDTDVFGRYGGDEFTVLLPETTPADALLVAERLRQVIAGQAFETRAGIFEVTISLGIASLPGQATSLLTLLEQADNNLYKAKNGGRNRIEA